MLTLPIKKKWFDMIASGEKKEEYREIKEYYETRFQNLFGAITIYPSSIFSERYEYELLQGNDVPEEIRQDRVQEIIFRNGYSKNSPQLKCKCILRLGKGKEEWGAEKGKVYYIIEILEKEKFETEYGVSGMDKEISMKQ